MIKEVIEFAGPYRLKNIKSLRARDGVAWNASIYKEGVKVGDVEDAGNGGPVRVYAGQEVMDDLVSYAKSKVGDAFEPEGMFLGALADYQDSIKRLKAKDKKTPVVIKDQPDDLDSYGVPQAYSTFPCANTSENLEKIRAKYPNHRLLSDELALWDAPVSVQAPRPNARPRG